MVRHGGFLGGILTVLLAFASTGCRVFDESLLAEDAGSDAGAMDGGSPVDSGPPPEAGCVPASPPERPAGADEAGEERLFALRDLVLDQRLERWRSIGYDLDGLCSALPDPARECALRDLTSPGVPDGVDGTDNAFGYRAPLLLFTFLGDLDARLRAVQEEGRGLILMRLLGWNGMDDDSRVEVILTHGVRAEPAAAADAGLSDGGTPDLWDGTGTFYGSLADFVGGDPTRPSLRNDNAYVAGRTLVVPLPERAALSWEGEGVVLTLELTAAVLTARIVDDGSALEEVVIAGRWPILDMLDGFEGLTFCPGTEGRSRVERMIDEIADVSETRGGVPETPCDAVSVGIGLTGYAGRWGGLEAPPPPPNPCG